MTGVDRLSSTVDDGIKDVETADGREVDQRVLSEGCPSERLSSLYDVGRWRNGWDR